MNLEQLHNEKLAAHSRENERPSICNECDQDPETCDGDPEQCEADIECERAESEFEARRDAYD